MEMMKALLWARTVVRMIDQLRLGFDLRLAKYSAHSVSFSFAGHTADDMDWILDWKNARARISDLVYQGMHKVDGGASQGIVGIR